MASSSTTVILTATVLVLSFFLTEVPIMVTGISCGQVLTYVSPCIPYIRGPKGPVLGLCCQGLRGIKRVARSTPDRKTVCHCLKLAACDITRTKPGLVSGLPSKCGIFLLFTISGSNDCSKVR